MADLVAQWERVQINTFTKWCNMHLAKKGQKIDSILTDFKDGVKLIQLLEIIGEGTIPRYVKAPKMRLHMIENVGKALKFIADHDVKLANIGPEAIVDGNRTLTLGMIWTVILRFAIQGLSEEGISAKQGLLLWCQRKTEGYKGVNVQDFQDSFKDGLAFCALIHRHRPDLLDFDGLSKENQRENLDLAFEVAAKHLDVPKLLETDDIVNMPKPDERSVMTYVAALYNVFSTYDKVETAGRRVAKFVNFLRTTEEMLHDYEKRATELKNSIDAKNAEIAAAAPGDTYTEVRNNIASFKDYKIQLKRKWVAEHSDLEALFSNIQSKLKSMNRPPYTPPEHIAPPALEKAMEEITIAERKYRSTLNTQMRNILDALRKAFADPANAFFNKLQPYRVELSKPIEGELETALASFEALQKRFIDELETELPVIKQAEDECVAANIEDNEYSDHSYEDLQYSYDQLKSVFAKKILFIQTQMAESKGGVPPEKLNEFRESFDHFDVNHDKELDRLEARSALSSLGVIGVDFSSGKDEEYDKLFNKISEGNSVISFDQYVKFMISITEDTVSPAQLEEAFRCVTGGKDFITEADFAKAQLTPEQIEFLKLTMPAYPGVEGAYDHKKWLAAH